jgi:hypothetical protein
MMTADDVIGQISGVFCQRSRRRMLPVGIPPWNAHGVLPPNNEVAPTSFDRSPYLVRLNDLVVRFGLTAERANILDGLLRYRAALHAIGLVQGFQWLDGSFLENVELLESRSPNDMDVVTFYRLPPGDTQSSLARRATGVIPVSLAERRAIKRRFHVDAYTLSLDEPVEGLIPWITYWYGMWSHRRSGDWKGYLQVDLAHSDDASASETLAAMVSPGVET